MALDAVCLQAAVREIAPQVEGLKIEKIQQPARDQVVLLLRGSRRLLLCASASQPRLNLTEVLRDNPSQAPMFCMLLRKHLSGGRIITLRQEPLERVVFPGAGGYEPPLKPDSVRRRRAHYRLHAAGGF